jgi:hypothetical protein
MRLWNTMTTKLNIYWEGTGKGISEHRLSIGEFGKSLELLLSAYRRIATNLINQAIEDATQSKRGRYHALASNLDLEISKISNGSIEIELVCINHTPEGSNYPLFDLAPQVNEVFLHSIAQESKGHQRDYAVRKYLRSLEGKVSLQRYISYEDSTIKQEVEIEEVHLPAEDLLVVAPALKLVVGHIVGVGFEPGPTEIHIKTEGKIISGKATAELVIEALKLREIEIQALLITKDLRFLWIKPANTLIAVLPDDKRKEAITDRWDNVLRRLSN